VIATGAQTTFEIGLYKKATGTRFGRVYYATGDNTFSGRNWVEVVPVGEAKEGETKTSEDKAPSVKPEK